MSAEPTHTADTANGAAAVQKGAKNNAKRPQSTQKAAAAAPRLTSAFPRGDEAGTVDFSKILEDGRNRMKEAVERMSSRWDSLRTSARETGDVMQESNSAAIQGMRDVNEQALENLQSDMDRAFDAMRALFEVRSFTDFMQIQNDFVRESMEAQLNQARSLSELSMSAARAAFEPLQSGFNHILEEARKGKR